MYCVTFFINKTCKKPNVFLTRTAEIRAYGACTVTDWTYLSSAIAVIEYIEANTAAMGKEVVESAVIESEIPFIVHGVDKVYNGVECGHWRFQRNAKFTRK